MIPAEERMRVVELGIAALRKSVQMTPDSFDSNVYLNLILREKAKLETDPVKQQELIAEAITYQDKAKVIVQKRKAQAAAAAPAAGPEARGRTMFETALIESQKKKAAANANG